MANITQQQERDQSPWLPWDPVPSPSPSYRLDRGIPARRTPTPMTLVQSPASGRLPRKPRRPPSTQPQGQAAPPYFSS